MAVMVCALLVLGRTTGAEVARFGSTDEAYEYALNLFHSDGRDACFDALQQILRSVPGYSPAIVSLGVLMNMGVRRVCGNDTQETGARHPVSQRHH